MAADRAATMATTIQISLAAAMRRSHRFFTESQQCAGQRERKREHGVFELDHLEGETQPFQEHSASRFAYHFSSCAILF